MRSHDPINTEAKKDNEVDIADEKAYNQITPFNFTSLDQQKKIDAAIAELIQLCKDNSGAIPRSHYKTSVQHLIKECIEVLSWQERNLDGVTILYYDSTFPEFLKWMPRKSTLLDPTYRPERTFILNRVCVDAAKYKVHSFNNNKIESSEFQREILQNPTKVKVYYPICYGYAKKVNLDSIQTVIKFFLDTLKILPENIFVYLGPYEPYNQSPDFIREEESRLLAVFMTRISELLENTNIKIVIYDNKNVRKDKHLRLFESNWYQTDKYREAEKHTIDILLGKLKKFSVDTFKTNISDAVVEYIESCNRNAVSSAALISNSLASSLNPAPFPRTILDVIPKIKVEPQWKIPEDFLNPITAWLICITFCDASESLINEAAEDVYSKFKTLYSRKEYIAWQQSILCHGNFFAAPAGNEMRASVLEQYTKLLAYAVCAFGNCTPYDGEKSQEKFERLGSFFNKVHDKRIPKAPCDAKIIDSDLRAVWVYDSFSKSWLSSLRTGVSTIFRPSNIIKRKGDHRSILAISHGCYVSETKLIINPKGRFRN